MNYEKTYYYFSMEVYGSFPWNIFSKSELSKTQKQLKQLWDENYYYFLH